MLRNIASKIFTMTEKDTFLYFGYGSNLLTERIHYQNPSAKAIGNAKLDDYKLEFRLTSKVNYHFMYINQSI